MGDNRARALLVFLAVYVLTLLVADSTVPYLHYLFVDFDYLVINYCWYGVVGMDTNKAYIFNSLNQLTNNAVKKCTLQINVE